MIKENTKHQTLVFTCACTGQHILVCTCMRKCMHACAHTHTQHAKTRKYPSSDHKYKLHSVGYGVPQSSQLSLYLTRSQAFRFLGFLTDILMATGSMFLPPRALARTLFAQGSFKDAHLSPLCQQLRQLEMQLEQEYEEKQVALHEKRDLEGLIGTLCDQVRYTQWGHSRGFKTHFLVQ